MQVKTIYKIMTASEWEAARAEGVYRGSAQDQRDGFIHLSTAAQIAGTARKYFSGVPDLVVLTIDIEGLELHIPHPSPLPPLPGELALASSQPSDTASASGCGWEREQAVPGATASPEEEGRDEGVGPLRWEPSRGGDLFPHLYAPLPSAAPQSVTPAPLDEDGTPILPHDLRS